MLGNAFWLVRCLWPMPGSTSKWEKEEKRGEESKFVRNAQERQEARPPILPLRGGSFGGWCFVGLVVSAESVFCGGGEF